MMEIVCPSCGKTNEMNLCRRCGCDLSSLFAIVAAAGIELVAAGKCLRTANACDARKHATRSWQLRHAPGAARSAFIACVVLGDFADARMWHQRVVGLPERRN